MKKVLLKISVILSISFLLFSCGGVEVSSEMADFNAMLKGSHEDVSAAVEKYAANEELESNDITYLSLTKPEVTAKDGDCYNVQYTTGIVVRNYEICWEQYKNCFYNGKINGINFLYYSQKRESFIMIKNH